MRNQNTFIGARSERSGRLDLSRSTKRRPPAAMTKSAADFAFYACLPIADAGHPPPPLDQAECFRLHHLREMRIGSRLIGDEIEEFPLRHHCDEVPAPVEAREIGRFEMAAAPMHAETAHLVVRTLKQPVQHAEFRE